MGHPVRRAIRHAEQRDRGYRHDRGYLTPVRSWAHTTRALGLHQPALVTDLSDVPAAKDKSGIGMPVGVNANPGFWDQYGPISDGLVDVSTDGTMFGNYNY
jgi:hypothetical protein